MVLDRKRKTIATILLTCFLILGIIDALAVGMQAICYIQSRTLKLYVPDVQRLDLNAILSKSSLSEEDYDVIYKQTGLTKIGVDRCLSHGEFGKERIKLIQEDYLGAYSIRNDYFAPFCCAAYVDKRIVLCYFEKGDVIISLSTYFSGITFGHAGLVVDDVKNLILQAYFGSTPSHFGHTADFSDSTVFVLLRPKIPEEKKTAIVDFAKNNLRNIPYSVTAGVLTQKESYKITQCAHIVWRAFSELGYDIDSNGGAVVTPPEIARSPLFELVQIFGADAESVF